MRGAAEKKAGTHAGPQTGTFAPPLGASLRVRWRGGSGTRRLVTFYSLTKTGGKQLAAEVRKWTEANALVARFLEGTR